ncbi:protein pygopus [Octopus bimaculoides]|uniref:PHD-type domain-containing protein n=2 Tax=Octopus TaxID=6643 RepID=A0A0L8GMB3_OCTBM|nr:protein pygopus [Octopus bimaculoides]XP_029658181.1 protein pygopus [Octopus sinensis]|eukprot:XP_014779726.1 PREDICTED: protein pygopus-like [Octopus bimaculoides]
MPRDRRVPAKNRADVRNQRALKLQNATPTPINSQPSPTIPELIPPPPVPPNPGSCAKTNTIFAQNPFDDQPIPSLNMPNKQMMAHAQPVGPPSGPSEKVYPRNKSMVFNPANPNAPPIYPCGTCHKEVHDSDQAILCESGCNFWFHRICTGLTEDAYHLLRAEVYAEWVCDKCLSTKNIPLVKMKP